MSNPKFMVFKLKDLKIPLIIFLIAIALFMFLLFKNKDATQTFAPSDTYQDGKYIAGISLSDAEMDLIVEVQDSKIASIALKGLDEKTSMLYKDLTYGIDYVNTYVTATQSLELPLNTKASAATHLLMDAIKVALSDDEHTQITSTYEKLNLTNTEATANTSLDLLNADTANEQVDADSAKTQVQDAAEDNAAIEASEHTSIIEEEVIEE
ncbi:hypothetical protein [Cellulosilyticum sp. I15G10I2]|uniref:hypothetical protein n=1 Tax=Cellulosilyticum sp. I15G10I2 TaxID=1892843 RepID=UPI00085CB301|nr:hypothetical protein [Cellulosilyticum sp. I15G10I2]